MNKGMQILLETMLPKILASMNVDPKVVGEWVESQRQRVEQFLHGTEQILARIEDKQDRILKEQFEHRVLLVHILDRLDLSVPKTEELTRG